MKKCIFIPIALLLIAAGAVAIAVATGAVQQPEVGTVSNSWGDVSRDETEIVSDIQVDNPNSFGLGAGNIGIEADVSMNDVKLGEGSADDIDLPAGQSTVQLTTVIDNNQIPAWWASHVENGERSTATISPTVNVSALGLSSSIDVPPITREIDTDLLASANSTRDEQFPFGPFTMTMKSRQFDWGDVSEDTTEIDGTIVLHHDAPVPVVVNRLEFTFTMNGIAIANAVTRDPVVIPPNTDTPVPFDATMDNEPMLDWWPTHVNNGETTDYQIDVDVVLAVESGILGGQTFPFQLIAYEDTFQTDILGQ